MRDIEVIRQFSQAAFGNRHRLEVLAAIGRGESEFYVAQLAKMTQIPGSTVTPIIHHLGDGLAAPLPRLARNAPQYFHRVEHPIWQLAVALLDQLYPAESVDSSPEDPAS